MEQTPILHCGECRQPIASGEHSVCFKVPGNVAYQFFHCRSRAGDCWECTLNTVVIDLGSTSESSTSISTAPASRLARRTK